MECNLVWNHTRDFKIERARSASSISNHKYDFRPKLHDPKSNYHFIKSILKSHDFMALNFRFSCIVPSRAGLLEIAEPERLQHLIKYAKRKLVQAQQTNKQFWSENENSHFDESKFDSCRLNQWWKTFLSSVVEVETSRCLWRRNLRVQPEYFCDWFLSCETPRMHDAQL